MEKFGFQFTTPEGVEVFISSPTTYTKTEVISLSIEWLKRLPQEDLPIEVKENEDRYYNEEGEVGVLVSPGFGSGFTRTLNIPHTGIPFNRNLIKKIIAGEKVTAEDVRREYHMEDHVMIFGLEDLTVQFLPKGTKFMIEEYDGSEYIISEKDLIYTA